MTKGWMRALGALLCGLPLPAVAGDLFSDDVFTLLRSETFSAEASAGYLTGTAREYVYATPGDGSKVSQLNWQTDRAATAGVRLAYRPFEWLSIRARGWSTVANDSAMDDFDFLAGYAGPRSWTHWSTSPNTDLVKAYQGDISAAVRIWGDSEMSVSGIAGYRYLTQKWNAVGGTYVYSVHGLRDATGTFPNQLGIAYQQWWETPYLGLGFSYSDDDLSITGEVIGSPWVMAHDKDHHALRTLLFTERFPSSLMVGGALGVEWRLTEMFSLTGRAEYQRYIEAKGSTRTYDSGTGISGYYPSPSAGADNESIHLTVGVKARL